MFQFLVTFVIGYLFGRSTKKCAYEGRSELPSPEATVVQFIHGNPDAIKLIKDVETLARQGDQDATLYWERLEQAFQEAEAQMEAAQPPQEAEPMTAAEG